jgi:hypothetical protein
MKVVAAGIIIFHSRTWLLCAGLPVSGIKISLCLAPEDRARAHKDRVAQTRKKTVKLYQLMRNMPKGAHKAMARLGASMK